ncbi:hypothetical protein DFH08DRAFT_823289 [Mycena albidolilacea]|uniref:Uncharacterized protein n=1 Tax=Mycena albidolilacea TaxID=1033008 RepID=A0AAD6Z6G2_9AGAR|nr:hypothetical protein DFH08DRAFT_823289 [Mycena albidolilacea]
MRLVGSSPLPLLHHWLHRLLASRGGTEHPSGVPFPYRLWESKYTCAGPTLEIMSLARRGARRNASVRTWFMAALLACLCAAPSPGETGTGGQALISLEEACLGGSPVLLPANLLRCSYSAASTVHLASERLLSAAPRPRRPSCLRRWRGNGGINSTGHPSGGRTALSALESVRDVADCGAPTPVKSSRSYPVPVLLGRGAAGAAISPTCSRAVRGNSYEQCTSWTWIPRLPAAPSNSCSGRLLAALYGGTLHSQATYAQALDPHEDTQNADATNTLSTIKRLLGLPLLRGTIGAFRDLDHKSSTSRVLHRGTSRVPVDEDQNSGLDEVRSYILTRQPVAPLVMLAVPLSAPTTPLVHVFKQIAHTPARLRMNVQNAPTNSSKVEYKTRGCGWWFRTRVEVEGKT